MHAAIVAHAGAQELNTFHTTNTEEEEEEKMYKNTFRENPRVLVTTVHLSDGRDAHRVTLSKENMGSVIRRTRAKVERVYNVTAGSAWGTIGTCSTLESFLNDSRIIRCQTLRGF
jgi:hypothetical protein